MGDDHVTLYCVFFLAQLLFRRRRAGGFFTDFAMAGDRDRTRGRVGQRYAVWVRRCSARSHGLCDVFRILGDHGVDHHLPSCSAGWYSKETAGALETSPRPGGGHLTPPSWGGGAFLVAEVSRLPLRAVCGCGSLPRSCQLSGTRFCSVDLMAAPRRASPPAEECGLTVAQTGDGPRGSACVP